MPRGVRRAERRHRVEQRPRARPVGRIGGRWHRRTERPPLSQVEVCVVDARDDHPPGERNLAGAASGEPPHVDRRAHRDDPVAADGECLRPRAGRVGGEHLTPGEDERGCRGAGRLRTGEGRRRRRGRHQRRVHGWGARGSSRVGVPRRWSPPASASRAAAPRRRGSRRYIQSRRAASVSIARWDDGPLGDVLAPRRSNSSAGRTRLLIVDERRSSRRARIRSASAASTRGPRGSRRNGRPSSRSRGGEVLVALALDEMDRVRAGGVTFGCVLADAGSCASAESRWALSARGLTLGRRDPQDADGLPRRRRARDAARGHGPPARAFGADAHARGREGGFGRRPRSPRGRQLARCLRT